MLQPRPGIEFQRRKYGSIQEAAKIAQRAAASEKKYNVRDALAFFARHFRVTDAIEEPHVAKILKIAAETHAGTPEITDDIFDHVERHFLR